MIKHKHFRDRSYPPLWLGNIWTLPLLKNRPRINLCLNKSNIFVIVVYITFDLNSRFQARFWDVLVFNQAKVVPLLSCESSVSEENPDRKKRKKKLFLHSCISKIRQFFELCDKNIRKMQFKKFFFRFRFGTLIIIKWAHH